MNKNHRFYNIIEKLRVRNRATQPDIYHVEDEDDVTEEIEKALWDIKEAMDIPTDEIEIAVKSRKNKK
jgi:hypothetical protein